MTKCRKCGRECEDTAQFCSACGNMLDCDENQMDEPNQRLGISNTDSMSLLSEESQSTTVSEKQKTRTLRLGDILAICAAILCIAFWSNGPYLVVNLASFYDLPTASAISQTRWSLWLLKQRFMDQLSM